MVYISSGQSLRTYSRDACRCARAHRMKISQAGIHQRNQEAYENDERWKTKKEKKNLQRKIVKIRRPDSTSKPPPH